MKLNKLVRVKLVPLLIEVALPSVPRDVTDGIQYERFTYTNMLSVFDAELARAIPML